MAINIENGISAFHPPSKIYFNIKYKIFFHLANNEVEEVTGIFFTWPAVRSSWVVRKDCTYLQKMEKQETLYDSFKLITIFVY